MKLQLNKKQLKNLTNDAQVLPADMTPQIGGGLGGDQNSIRITDRLICDVDHSLVPTGEIMCPIDM
jgi:hypothetical protein